MNDFIKAVERNLKGIAAFSVGASIECQDCLAASDICCKHKAEHMLKNNVNLVEKTEFSTTSCDSCGSHLAGERYAAHGLIASNKIFQPWIDTENIPPEKTEVIHLEICIDCLLYHANGELPENWKP